MKNIIYIASMNGSEYYYADYNNAKEKLLKSGFVEVSHINVVEGLKGIFKREIKSPWYGALGSNDKVEVSSEEAQISFVFLRD